MKHGSAAVEKAFPTCQSQGCVQRCARFHGPSHSFVPLRLRISPSSFGEIRPPVGTSSSIRKPITAVGFDEACSGTAGQRRQKFVKYDEKSRERLSKRLHWPATADDYMREKNVMHERTRITMLHPTRTNKFHFRRKLVRSSIFFSRKSASEPKYHHLSR